MKLFSYFNSFKFPIKPFGNNSDNLRETLNGFYMDVFAKFLNYMRIVFVSLFGLLSLYSQAADSLVLNKQGDMIFDNLSKSIEQSRVKNSKENFDLLNDYRKFYLEDEKLDYFCRENSAKLYFKNGLERDEFYRTIMATLQYKMMTYSMHAIATYAKKLQFDSEQYDNLVRSLISKCSQNITLMGHRLIKYHFDNYFKDEGEIFLPIDQRKKLFTDKLNKLQSENEILVNELYYTTGIFSHACSWGGQVEYPRELSKFLSSSAVMSFIIRELSGLDTYSYDDKLSDKKGALCRNQICRPKEITKIQNGIIRPVGSANLNFDFKLAYCEKFRFSSPKYSTEVSPELVRALDEFKEERPRLIGQFLALVTRIPDFNVWTHDSKTIKDYISLSNDGLWDFWASDYLKSNSKKLSYEEALVMQVDKEVNNYFVYHKSFPQINFNVLHGEFDKASDINNMLGLHFDINIPRTDIKWIYEQYKIAHVGNDDKSIKKLKERLALYVENDYKDIKDTLMQFSVNADLTQIITDELFRQFDIIELPKGEDNRQLKIGVNIRIAPFALVAIRNKRIVSDLSSRDLSEIKSLETLNNIDSMASEAKK